jgi:hypothetical protein
MTERRGRLPRSRGERISVVTRVLGLLGWMLGIALAPTGVRAEPSVYVAPGSEWRFFRGLEEASTPDVAAWRDPGFDDSGWTRGRASFGFGEGVDGTDLSALEPPMRSNYTSIYLRRAFELSDPSAVVTLDLRLWIDDGAIIWINGVEVFRINAPDVPTFDAIATAGREGAEPETFDELPEPVSFLRPGRNVVAVQAFNVTKSSADFKVDVELFDPFGPDLSPPSIARLVPASGRTVRFLDRIEVTFSESVAGVDASDLLIDGRRSTSVSGDGPGPFIFVFEPLADGEHSIRWSEGHGIADLSPAANRLPLESWDYVVDSEAPLDDVVISEIVARPIAGRGAWLDEDRQAVDWMELHNRGVLAADLTGWALSDDAEDLGKWALPSVTLEPDARIVVFASEKDRRVPGQPLHTNFRLSGDGEFLALSNAESPRRIINAFSPRYPIQRSGWSYGRDDDGSVVYFSPPTPGAPNSGAETAGAPVSAPSFSVGRGFHDEAFSLELVASSSDVEILYTLDGSDPTSGGALRYGGPIEIRGEPGRGIVTVRAAAFLAGRLPSEVVTQSHVFPASVLEQPRLPDGFPARWGAQPADYEVDPRVVATDPQRAREALLSIPTISITAPIADLFDARTGIYANPSRSGPGEERKVSAEFLFPDGKAAEQIDCGMRIQGGSSTGGWKSAKLSLRLRFTSDFGPSELRLPLFDDSSVDRFDTLVLDAHLNLAYTHPDHSQRVRSLFVRDILVADLQNATGSLAPRGRFVHLYLNGLYWGLYDVHERPDDSFASDHLGGAPEDWDIYRHNFSTLVDGDSRAWNAMFQAARPASKLRDPQAYLELGARWLDLVDLCDYMIINIWAGNTDWAHHNWYAGRRRSDGAGYRFFSWDAEHTFKEVGDNVTGVSQTGGPGELYANLRQSAEFRLLFADHVERHLGPGGILWVDPEHPAVDPDHPERNRPGAFYLARIDEIDPAVVLESARWGDTRRPALPYTYENEFLAEHRRLLTTYFPRRSAIVLDQLRAAGLYPRVAAPLVSVPAGAVEPGTAVLLSLAAGGEGRIFYTIDGSDPRVFASGDVSSSAREFDPRGGAPLIVDDHTILRARVLHGTDWSAMREAEYTVVRPRDALRISEIHYNAPEGAAAEFIEIQNVARVGVGLGGLRFEDGIEFEFDPGERLALGGVLVLVRDADAFAAAHPGAPAPFGVYDGDLSDAGERLLLVDANGGVVVDVSYDDGIDWPRGADGLGWSLVLRDPGLDPRRAESWEASEAAGGSPGRLGGLGPSWSVRISEALARSSAPFEDAIELFNAGDRSVDLGGWFLSDDLGSTEDIAKYSFPPGTTIPAGGYRVVYERELRSAVDPNRSWARRARGAEVGVPAVGPNGALDGWVRAFEIPAGDENSSWGPISAGSDIAIAPFEVPTFGAAAPASIDDFRQGTGAPNSAVRVGSVVLHELHYHPAVGLEFIELRNRSGDDAALHDAALGRGYRVHGVLDASGVDDYEFEPGVVIPAGGYLLLVPVDPAIFRATRSVPAEALVVGPYSGALDNGGETLRLEAPTREGGEVLYALVDELRYDDVAPWPEAADGAGSSLERRDPGAWGRDPSNWGASLRGGGTPGADNSVLAGENLAPFAAFSIVTTPSPLAVELDASGSRDPDGRIVAWDWELGDGTVASGVRIEHSYAQAGFHAITLRVLDDRGASASTTRIIEVGSSGGGQRPGDASQNGRLEITDAIWILRRLFLEEDRPLPCGAGGLDAPENRVVYDVDDDGRVVLTDAIDLLRFLFASGVAPALGLECRPVLGCADACP